MKRGLFLLLLCVLVFGIVIFISPGASALQIVGDPIEGNSFFQGFRFDARDGLIDAFEMIVSGGGNFKTPGLSIGSNWHRNPFNQTRLSAWSNDGHSGFGFGASFFGDREQSFSMSIISYFNGQRTNGWNLGFNQRFYIVGRSVPDADIMWLIGPALIILGLVGRKKYSAIHT